MVIPYPACLSWQLPLEPSSPLTSTLEVCPSRRGSAPSPNRTVLRALGDLASLWSGDGRLRGYESGAEAVLSPREEVAKCRGLITLSGGRSTPSVSLEPR